MSNKQQQPHSHCNHVCVCVLGGVRTCILCSLLVWLDVMMIRYFYFPSSRQRRGSSTAHLFSVYRSVVHLFSFNVDFYLAPHWEGGYDVNGLVCFFFFLTFLFISYFFFPPLTPFFPYPFLLNFFLLFFFFLSLYLSLVFSDPSPCIVLRIFVITLRIIGSVDGVFVLSLGDGSGGNGGDGGRMTRYNALFFWVFFCAVGLI